MVEIFKELRLLSDIQSTRSLQQLGFLNYMGLHTIWAFVLGLYFTWAFVLGLSILNQSSTCHMTSSCIISNIRVAISRRINGSQQRWRNLKIMKTSCHPSSSCCKGRGQSKDEFESKDDDIGDDITLHHFLPLS